MGPGLLLKAILHGSFSLLVFGWAQIVMDLQPLFAMISGTGRLHGFSHTYLGAALLAVASALSGKYLAEFGLRLIGNARYAAIEILWPVALISAVLGTFSHVALDSIMHTDITPYFPVSDDNHLLAVISVDMLHKFCIYTGIVGGATYFLLDHLAVRRTKKKQTGAMRDRAP
jgi:hypothetical protein